MDRPQGQQKRHERPQQGRAPTPCGWAAAALLAALLAAALTPAMAVKGISGWESGIMTHYGGAQDGMDPSSPSFGTKDGACGYGQIPKDQYPYFSAAALSTSSHFYTSDELHGCGQCFQLQCADDRQGVCKTDSAGKPLSVMVMISDQCPECGSDHVDVQSLTFAKLADPGIGRIKMQYRRVECTPPDDMKVSIMDYRGAGGWIRLAVDDTGGRAAVKSVAVKGASGDWKQMTNNWGATWELSNAPGAPLSFKIVGDDGETVTAENVVKQNGGISGGAFSARATFSAGTQFSITDPAVQEVQAFDGPSDPMLITSSTPGASDNSGVPSPGRSANATSNGTAHGSSSTTTATGNSTTNSSSAQQGKQAGSGDGQCSDTPTPDGHSCAQQKGWGKCEEGFIKDNGYCKATCGKCGGGGSSSTSGSGSSANSANPTKGTTSGSNNKSGSSSSGSGTSSTNNKAGSGGSGSSAKQQASGGSRSSSSNRRLLRRLA